MLYELGRRYTDWVMTKGRDTRRCGVGFFASQAIAPLAPRHTHNPRDFTVVEGLEENVVAAHTQNICPETIIGMAAHYKFQRWVLELRNVMEDVLPRSVWQVAFANYYRGRVFGKVFGSFPAVAHSCDLPIAMVENVAKGRKVFGVRAYQIDGKIFMCGIWSVNFLRGGKHGRTSFLSKYSECKTWIIKRY